MSRGWRIFVIVLSVVAVLAVAAVLTADVVLTKLADKALREHIRAIDNRYVDYGSVHVRVGSRSVEMHDVVFSTDTIDSLTSAGLLVRVEKVAVKHISLRRLIRDKCLSVGKLSIDNPHVQFLSVAEENKPQNEPPVADSTKTNSWLAEVEIKRIDVSGASFALRYLDNQLQLNIDSADVKTGRVGYNLRSDSLFYDDSAYSLLLRRLSFMSSNGLFSARIRELSTEDTGAINVQGIIAGNTVGKFDLADRMGKVPVTWAHAEISRLTTSACNLPRLITQKRLLIDTIVVEGERLQVLRDVRYKPKEQYPMPQQEIMSIPVPLEIKTVKSEIAKLEVEFANQIDHCGKMDLRKMNVTIKNFTNSEKATTHITTKGLMGENAKLNLGLNLTNDKKCHFSADMRIQEATGAALDGFLIPLAGVNLRTNLHDMHCTMAGDSKSATGDFCMIYDSLKINIDKTKMPVEVVAKHAGVINFVLSLMVPVCNPRNPGHEPFTCKVSAERDPMDNFAMYMFGPVIDGLEQTLLPKFVHNTIKNKQAKQTAASGSTDAKPAPIKKAAKK